VKFRCGQERRIGGHETLSWPGEFPFPDEIDTTGVGGHVEHNSPHRDPASHPGVMS